MNYYLVSKINIIFNFSKYFNIFNKMKNRKPSKSKLSKKDKLKWLVGLGERLSNKLREDMSFPEKKLNVLLEQLPYEFISQEPIIVRGKLFIMDFYFPKKKLCIEVQSFTYHSSEIQKKKDSIKKRKIKSVGIRMLYLWATQIESLKKEELNKLLE